MDLISFQFNGSGSVRIIIQESGELLFVGKDVCDVLGYKNPNDALANLDEDDRNTLAISEGIRGNPNQICITEGGLYQLIFTSTLPKAKEFKKWVTHKVLPEIRITGGYGVASVTPILKNVQRAMELNERKEILATEIKAINKELKTLSDNNSEAYKKIKESQLAIFQ
jgi:anti-repressor protein